MRAFIILLPVTILGVLLQGCYTPRQRREPEKTVSQADARVDFTDPVLNRRQILLFGKIDQRAFGIEHILSAEQALEYGIVDEIVDR